MMYFWPCLRRDRLEDCARLNSGHMLRFLGLGIAYANYTYAGALPGPEEPC